MDEDQPCERSDQVNLGDLSISVLETILADLMAVKYPGVELADVNRLLAALSSGDLVLVCEVEADIAEKSARWTRFMLDMDR